MIKRVHFRSASVPPGPVQENPSRVASFEVLLDHIGGWGFYQKRLWFMVYIVMETAISMNTVQISTAASKPEADSRIEFRCT